MLQNSNTSSHKIRSRRNYVNGSNLGTVILSPNYIGNFVNINLLTADPARRWKLVGGNLIASRSGVYELSYGATISNNAITASPGPPDGSVTNMQFVMKKNGLNIESSLLNITVPVNNSITYVDVSKKVIVPISRSDVISFSAKIDSVPIITDPSALNLLNTNVTIQIV